MMRCAALTPLLILVTGAIDRRTVVSRHDVLLAAAAAANLDTDNGVLTVGNGAFGFNVDATGLQSFNDSYTHLGVNTLADWGYHTKPFTPTDATQALRAYNFTYYDTPTSGNGSTRRVPYANDGSNDGAVIAWLTGNPHRLNLGQLSLRWAVKSNTSNASTPLVLSSISNSSQALRLWSGLIESNFTLSPPAPATCAVVSDNSVTDFSCGGDSVITAVTWASYGRPTGSCAARNFAADPQCDATTTRDVLTALCVGQRSCSLSVNYEAGFGDPCSGQAKWLAANVTCSAAAATPSGFSVLTVAHPDVDLASVSVVCRAGPCPVVLHLAFPYGTSAFGVSGADWDAPSSAHSTTVVQSSLTGLSLLRGLDSDAYRVDCAWSAGTIAVRRVGPHAFDLVAGGGGGWPASGAGVSCLYSPVGEGGRVHFPVGSSQPWLVNKTAETQELVDAAAVPPFSVVAAASAAFWAQFWTSGAFVELASAVPVDPSAWELERRVVLSQVSGGKQVHHADKKGKISLCLDLPARTEYWAPHTCILLRA